MVLFEKNWNFNGSSQVRHNRWRGFAKIAQELHGVKSARAWLEARWGFRVGPREAEGVQKYLYVAGNHA